MELQTVRFIVWSASFGAGPARFLTCLEIMFFFQHIPSGRTKKEGRACPSIHTSAFLPCTPAPWEGMPTTAKNAACLEWPHTFGERLYGYCEIGRLRLIPWGKGS